MADLETQIQNLPEKHRERVWGEYIKMRINQRQRRGWRNVNMEIHDRFIRKLKIASLRQFIPTLVTIEENNLKKY